MGTELLVASLWGVVLVYWFWSRRPSTADTIGLFRHELRVLEHATPTRVAPAYRLNLDGPPTGLAPLAAAALVNQRMIARRRRRDILCLLLGLVVVTLLVAVFTGSAVALVAQAVSDLALVVYLWLLATMARARAAGGTARLSATNLRRRAPRHPEVGDRVPPSFSQAAFSPVTATPAPGPLPGPAMATPVPRHPRPPSLAPLGLSLTFVDDAGEEADEEDSYVPAHAARGRLTSGARPLFASVRAAPSYGDFDSYASLALARAN